MRLKIMKTLKINGYARIGERKEVFKGKKFSIFQATGILPDGTEKLFEYCIRPPAVRVLALDDHNRLLLTREFRAHRKVVEWFLPGGVVDVNEPFRVAAQREFREETGYRARVLKFFMETTKHATMQFVTKFYVARALVKDPLPKADDEEIDVQFVALNRACEMAAKGEINSDYFSLAIMRMCYRVKKDGVSSLFE